MLIEKRKSTEPTARRAVASGDKIDLRSNGSFTIRGIKEIDLNSRAPGNQLDNWPAGVAFPSPKEGEISIRAWRELGIKVVPATRGEQAFEARSRYGSQLKVVAGVPRDSKDPNSPVFLVSLNDLTLKSFDDLATALDKVKGQRLIVARFAINSPRGPTFLEVALDGAKPNVSASRPGQSPPTADAAPKSSSKFPALEDQKLADLAYKRLGLELEPIGADDLKRVQALGYDGGLNVAAGTAGVQGASTAIVPGDILVGLHVWPTTNMKSLAEILNRDDLAELNPLKFYVVRSTPDAGDPKTKWDNPIAGRVNVQLNSGFGGEFTTKSIFTKPRPVVAETAPDTSTTPATSEATPATNQHSVPSTQYSSSRSSSTKSATPPTRSDRYSATIVKPADEESEIATYEIPKDLVDAVNHYVDRFRRNPGGGVWTAWDDRGRLIMQAPRADHDNLAKLLEFTPKWRASSAAADPSASPIVVRKVGDEDVLEWRTVGLTFVRDQHSAVPTSSRRSDGSLRVSEVAPGSPAAWADVQPGDTLTSLGSFRASTIPELEKLINTLREGYRHEKQLSVSFYRLRDRGGFYFEATFPLKPAKPDAEESPRSGRPATGEGSGRYDSKPATTTISQSASSSRSSSPAPTALQPQSGNVPRFNTTTPVVPSNSPYLSLLKDLPNEHSLVTTPSLPTGNAVITGTGKINTTQLTTNLPTTVVTGVIANDQIGGEPLRFSGVTTIVPNKSTFRYEGKSFDDWRDSLRTELDAKKRFEAVKALVAFGAAGYGREATEAILAAAAQYDWDAAIDDIESPRGKLLQLIIDAFSCNPDLAYSHEFALGAIPAEVWLPIFIERLKTDDKNIVRLTRELLAGLPRGTKIAIEPLLELSSNKSESVRDVAISALWIADPDFKDPRIVARWNELLKSSNPEEVAWAVGTGKTPPLEIDWLAMLFNPNDHIRLVARGRLAYSGQVEKLMPELVKIANDSNRFADHLKAIRAIGALGRLAIDAYADLDKIMLDSKRPLQERVAAMTALQQIDQSDAGSVSNKLDEAFQREHGDGESAESRMAYAKYRRAKELERDEQEPATAPSRSPSTTPLSPPPQTAVSPPPASPPKATPTTPLMPPTSPTR